MSTNRHKNFSPEAINLLANMINMTLNKAEELSRRNQLATENSRDESSKIIDNKELPEHGSLSFLKPILIRTDSSIDETQPVAAYGNSMDVFSEAVTSGEKGRTVYEPIKIQIPKECPSATFSYMMKAFKDNKDIYVPAKIAVTQREADIDISFHLDTQIHPEFPPLYIRIFCPNYEPKQVWINGKKCIY
ncbi:hypothetical protein X798_03223 [Onchocerca flexuosa]|uniref:Uncharacterized protein n=1 Tax=Onchocerca flexuosa TaxID=387005 RepID=A0A238BYN2_9BILA|nr:hypothetical protein X798_03223 [Onchocerca flexuosa]